MKNVFPFVHKEVINPEDTMSRRRTPAELSYFHQLGLLVLLQHKCSIWQNFMYPFWDVIRKNFNFP